jgi:hypothetical protein
MTPKEHAIRKVEELLRMGPPVGSTLGVFPAVTTPGEDAAMLERLNKIRPLKIKMSPQELRTTVLGSVAVNLKGFRFLITKYAVVPKQGVEEAIVGLTQDGLLASAKQEHPSTKLTLTPAGQRQLRSDLRRNPALGELLAELGLKKVD